MRTRSIVARAGLTVTALVASALVVPATAGAQQAGSTATSSAADVRYSVLAADSAGVAATAAAVRAAGGRVVETNAEVGLLAVDAPDQGFVAAVSASSAVAGVARQRVVGHSPDAQPTASQVAQVEQENRTAARANGQGGRAAAAPGQNKHAPSTTAGMDPLDDQLWGLRWCGRTWRAGHRGEQAGQRRHHGHRHRRAQPRHRAELRPRPVAQLRAPDIPEHRRAVRVRRLRRPGRPRRRRSRHARRRHDRGRRQRLRASPAWRRTSASSTSAPARTPASSSCSRRVDALTYAGDAGIDVVNMSFFVDPWLYNCQRRTRRTRRSSRPSSARSSRR